MHTPAPRHPDLDSAWRAYADLRGLAFTPQSREHCYRLEGELHGVPVMVESYRLRTRGPYTPACFSVVAETRVPAGAHLRILRRSFLGKALQPLRARSDLAVSAAFEAIYAVEANGAARPLVDARLCAAVERFRGNGSLELDAGRACFTWEDAAPDFDDLDAACAIVLALDHASSGETIYRG